MLVEVTVADIGLDPASNSPVMFLKEITGGRSVPIWIGVAEASAIAIARGDNRPERPLTHDLLKSIIDGMHSRLTRVVIDDLRNNTFFAKLYLERDNEITAIDARPSDAVAVALRTKAPIFVDEKIFTGGKTDHAAATAQQPDSALTETNANELRDILRNTDPSDFGKYSL